MTVLFVNGDTGNDGNAGTEALPKLTIQAAVTAAAAGDTVVVLACTVNPVYRERVVVDTKERITITSIPTTTANGMARLSCATATQAADWTAEGSNVYSITEAAAGIDELDQDPWVVFDTQVSTTDDKVPRLEGTYLTGAAIIAALLPGTYRFLGPKLYLKRPNSDAPVNNEIRVPCHKAAADPIAAIVVKNSSFITIENLQVEEFGRNGVYVASTSTRVVLRNLVVKDGVGDGLHVEGTKNLADRCQVQNDAPQIESTATGSVYYMDGVLPKGIALNNGRDCIVSHNDVSTFVGAGIHTGYSGELSDGSTAGLYGDNVVMANRVYDQRASAASSYVSGGLYTGVRGADAELHDYWRGNLVYQCNDTGVLLGGSLAVLAHNVVSRCARGYLVDGAHDNVVANNIFNLIGTMAGPFPVSQQSWNVLDPTAAGYHLVEGSFYHEGPTAAETAALQTNILRRNLYYRAAGTPLFVWGTTLYSADGWVDQVSPTLLHDGDFDLLTTDPQFVAQSTNDYHLLVASPALGTAAPVEPYGDADSKAWHLFDQVQVHRDARDLGAFELEDPPIQVEDVVPLLTRGRPSSGGTGPSGGFLKEALTTLSLGGLETTRPLVEPLFGPVDSAGIPTTGTSVRYRALDIKNLAILPVFTAASGTPTTNLGTDATASTVKFYLVGQAPLTKAGDLSTVVQAGWESAAPFNTAVANESTAPADVTFAAPETEGTATAVPSTGVSASGTGPTLVGTLKTAAGQSARLWVARTVYPGAEFHRGATATIRIFWLATSL